MDYIQQMQRTASISSQTQHIPLSPQRGVVSSNQTELLTEVKILKEQLQNTQNQFERFQQISKQKIYALEKEMYEFKEEYQKAKEVLLKLNDREVVQQTRNAVANRKDRAPVNRPIDRNNVAPSSVQLEKIFNCSGKKF